MVTIAVPILNRPERIEVVLDRFDGFDVLFLPDHTDGGSIRELKRIGANYSLAPVVEAFGVPTYASKVNKAYEASSTPYLFYGSDDISPVDGWWENALSHFQEDPNIGLLGAYDGLRPHANHRRNATHGIISREYVEEFGSASLPDAGPIFWEGYRHACVDVELTGVARKRNRYKYASDVQFRHERTMDGTTLLGESYLEEDRARMNARSHKWR